MTLSFLSLALLTNDFGFSRSSDNDPVIMFWNKTPDSGDPAWYLQSANTYQCFFLRFINLDSRFVRSVQGFILEELHWKYTLEIDF